MQIRGKGEAHVKVRIGRQHTRRWFATLVGISRKRLVQNTGWMVAGQGLRLIVQAIYFILIARALGVTNYGTFVAAAAFVAVLAPFATWGAGNILVKNVARSPASFGRYWGAALRTTVLSCVFLSVVGISISRLVLPPTVSSLLIGQVVLADLLFARLVDVGGQAFQGFSMLSRTAMTQFLISVVRLSAASVLFLSFHDRATAQEWASLYLAASIIPAIVTVYWVQVELGAPDWSGRLSAAEWVEGFQFSITTSAQSVNNDIDKIMLARLSALDAAGLYAAGYRILDVSFAPIRSVLYAAYSRFFLAGASGICGSVGLAKRLLPVALGYGAAIAAALYVIAPVLPRLLGAQYASSVSVIRLLCMLPLIRGIQSFAADSLTGADHQGLRSAVQVGVAMANVLLNLWLIPRYSWRGAVWSTILCDSALAISLWTTIWILMWRSTRTAIATAAPSIADQSAI